MIRTHTSIMTKLTFIKIDIAEMSMADLAAVISSIEDCGYSVLSSSFLKGTNEEGAAYQICVLTCRRPGDKARYMQLMWPIHIKWDVNIRNKTKANTALKAQLDLKRKHGGQIVFVNPETYVEQDENGRCAAVCTELCHLAGTEIQRDMFSYDDCILVESGINDYDETNGIFDPVHN
jgi:hypothetical protein